MDALDLVVAMEVLDITIREQGMVIMLVKAILVPDMDTLDMVLVVAATRGMAMAQDMVPVLGVMD